MSNQTEKTRVERDLIGEKEVPQSALYGIQTLRGIENFNISNFKLNQYPHFIQGLALTKKGATLANHKIGLISDKLKEAIVRACDEILEGKFHDHFPIDMIQGGAGTTTNMNANEVIANRALEIMGHQRGEYNHCSPNDHVNCSQSTNDAYPTAVHIGLYLTHIELLKPYKKLINSLKLKGDEFKEVIKVGRTQLQDAVPMSLGQTFHGFASILEDEIKNIDFAAKEFLTISMGATAIGTGICTVPSYAKECANALSAITGFKFQTATDLIGATSDTSSLIGYSSALKRIAVKLNKICNDLRLLSSGPRCGLGEIGLPEMQPGSSIMPGKINPVIPEVVNQIAYKIMGNDTCVTLGGNGSQMELNAMEPIMVQCCFESANLLQRACETLRTLCIEGIIAHKDKCKSDVMNSIGIVTALNPIIGYYNSTKIAKEALETGASVYNLILKHNILSKKDLDIVLAPENLIQPVNLDIQANNTK